MDEQENETVDLLLLGWKEKCERLTSELEEKKDIIKILEERIGGWNDASIEACKECDTKKELEAERERNKKLKIAGCEGCVQANCRKCIFSESSPPTEENICSDCGGLGKPHVYCKACKFKSSPTSSKDEEKKPPRMMICEHQGIICSCRFTLPHKESGCDGNHVGSDRCPPCVEVTEKKEVK